MNPIAMPFSWRDVGEFYVYVWRCQHAIRGQSDESGGRTSLRRSTVKVPVALICAFGVGEVKCTCCATAVTTQAASTKIDFMIHKLRVSIVVEL